MPLQGLFFMNSDLVNNQANTLAARLLQESDNDEDRIQRAYRIVFERPATQAEVQRGLQFLSKADVLFKQAPAEPMAVQAPRARPQAVNDEDGAPLPRASAPATKMTPWEQYTQALLSSGEFYYIN